MQINHLVAEGTAEMIEFRLDAHGIHQQGSL